MDETAVAHLAIQIARLEGKVDNLVVVAMAVQDHEKRLIKMETASDARSTLLLSVDTRMDALERTQWKIMSIASVIGATLGAVGTWLIEILIGTHH